MDEKSMNIQWYPGHMTKTRRIMEEDLKLVDAVCEILDARIPISSRNPDIDTICGSKPRMIILNRIDMADPAMVARWSEYFKRKGWAVIQTDCKSRKGINQFAPAVRTLLAEKLARYAEKGQVGRPLKLMVVGIPNVGKSSLINRLCGGKKVKVEDRPGVTFTKQWVPTSLGLDLMDMPGVLWPKFDDPRTGENLAMTGAIKDDILDTEQLAATLCARLMTVAPDKFCARYKLERVTLSDKNPHELLEAVAKKRGFLLSGGVIDTERAAAIVLDEFRGGKIGRISLETPATDPVRQDTHNAKAPATPADTAADADDPAAPTAADTAQPETKSAVPAEVGEGEI